MLPIDALGIEGRSTANNAVHLVALAEQQPGEMEPCCAVMPVMRAFFVNDYLMGLAE
jgi:hypothetical protein